MKTSVDKIIKQIPVCDLLIIVTTANNLPLSRVYQQMPVSLSWPEPECEVTLAALPAPAPALSWVICVSEWVIVSYNVARTKHPCDYLLLAHIENSCIAILENEKILSNDFTPILSKSHGQSAQHSSSSHHLISFLPKMKIINQRRVCDNFMQNFAIGERPLLWLKLVKPIEQNVSSRPFPRSAAALLRPGPVLGHQDQPSLRALLEAGPEAGHSKPGADAESPVSP